MIGSGGNVTRLVMAGRCGDGWEEAKVVSDSTARWMDRVRAGLRRTAAEPGKADAALVGAWLLNSNAPDEVCAAFYRVAEKGGVWGAEKKEPAASELSLTRSPGREVELHDATEAQSSQRTAEEKEEVGRCVEDVNGRRFTRIEYSDGTVEEFDDAVLGMRASGASAASEILITGYGGGDVGPEPDNSAVRLAGAYVDEERQCVSCGLAARACDVDCSFCGGRLES